MRYVLTATNVPLRERPDKFARIEANMTGGEVGAGRVSGAYVQIEEAYDDRGDLIPGFTGLWVWSGWLRKMEEDDEGNDTENSTDYQRQHR